MAAVNHCRHFAAIIPLFCLKLTPMQYYHYTETAVKRFFETQYVSICTLKGVVNYACFSAKK